MTRRSKKTHREKKSHRANKSRRAKPRNRVRIKAFRKLVARAWLKVFMKSGLKKRRYMLSHAPTFSEGKEYVKAARLVLLTGSRRK